jgi:hypothetical protein
MLLRPPGEQSAKPVRDLGHGRLRRVRRVELDRERVRRVGAPDAVDRHQVVARAAAAEQQGDGREEDAAKRCGLTVAGHDPPDGPTAVARLPQSIAYPDDVRNQPAASS